MFLCGCLSNRRFKTHPGGTYSRFSSPGGCGSIRENWLDINSGHRLFEVFLNDKSHMYSANKTVLAYYQGQLEPLDDCLGTSSPTTVATPDPDASVATINSTDAIDGPQTTGTADTDNNGNSDGNQAGTNAATRTDGTTIIAVVPNATSAVFDTAIGLFVAIFIFTCMPCTYYLLRETPSGGFDRHGQKVGHTPHTPVVLNSAYSEPGNNGAEGGVPMTSLSPADREVISNRPPSIVAADAPPPAHVQPNEPRLEQWQPPPPGQGPAYEETTLQAAVPPPLGQAAAYVETTLQAAVPPRNNSDLPKMGNANPPPVPATTAQARSAPLGPLDLGTLNQHHHGAIDRATADKRLAAAGHFRYLLRDMKDSGLGVIVSYYPTGKDIRHSRLTKSAKNGTFRIDGKPMDDVLNMHDAILKTIDRASKKSNKLFFPVRSPEMHVGAGTGAPIQPYGGLDSGYVNTSFEVMSAALSQLPVMDRLPAEAKLKSAGVVGGFFLRQKGDTNDKAAVSVLTPGGKCEHFMMNLVEDADKRGAQWVHRGESLRKVAILEAAMAMLADKHIANTVCIDTASIA